MNLNTKKGLFFKNILILGLVLITVGCKKEIEDTAKPVEGGAKLVFTVKGMNNELSKINNKIASVSRLSSGNIEKAEPQVEAFSKQVSLVSQSINGGRPSSFESSNRLVNEKKLSKMAGVVPVDHDIRYRLLLFDNETNDLVANVEAKVNQALTINVTAGRSYYWRAYSHNSKEVMAPLNVSNSNTNFESSIDKDLLWDASVDPITASTLTDSLGIVFDYKVAEFVINLDTEGLYGDISDLSMEFGSDSYFKKGTLNLKTGVISDPTTVSIAELSLSDFEAVPESKILQAKFYTVDPANITDFTLKVKKVTVNQDNNNLNELHKSTDPVKDVNFTFIPSLSKSHVASMAFRYKIPTKTILHVTRTNDDPAYSFAAQPSVDPYVGPWVSSQHRQAFNLIKSPNNFGIDANSRVHTDGFTHLRCVDDGTLDTKLGLKPDIVIISRYYTLDANDITALISYLNDNGVVIMMSDNSNGSHITSVVTFMNTLFGRSDIAWQNNINGFGSLLRINHTGRLNDKIVNGPFGNLEGKYWGNDGFHVVHLNNLPLGLGTNEATAYSDPQADNVVPEIRSTTFPSMFKHNSKNLFWIGNGSFLRSQANTSSGISSNVENEWGNYPFAVNENFEPISKKYGYNLGTYDNVIYNKGISYGSEVDNSALFANLMTWALYQSEFFGINTSAN